MLRRPSFRKKEFFKVYLPDQSSQRMVTHTLALSHTSFMNDTLLFNPAFFVLFCFCQKNFLVPFPISAPQNTILKQKEL